jgi:hypothetical protein
MLGDKDTRMYAAYNSLGNYLGDVRASSKKEAESIAEQRFDEGVIIDSL